VSNNGLFFAAALLLPAFLFSHGVEVSQSNESAKVIRFSYTDGEPMMYAKIKLYSPSSPKIETIKSLTDENGFFAFVPHEEGEWRVEARDGMGHRGEIVVNIAGGSFDTAVMQNSSSASTVFRIILGLSLLFNVFAAYGFVLKKSQNLKPPKNSL
jgi:nickel transport protein